MIVLGNALKTEQVQVRNNLRRGRESGIPTEVPVRTLRPVKPYHLLQMLYQVGDLGLIKELVSVNTMSN